MQDGINIFRKQYPSILHDTVLNEIKGNPEYELPVVTGDASDLLMWDKNCPLPVELSEGSKVANATSPPLKMNQKAINKNEAFAKLRKYILSVNDDRAMK